MAPQHEEGALAPAEHLEARVLVHAVPRAAPHQAPFGVDALLAQMRLQLGQRPRQRRWRADETEPGRHPQAEPEPDEGEQDAPDHLAHGARTSTSGWLGTMRKLGTLVLLAIDMLVSRVIGIALTSTVNAAVTGRAGPITVPEATPIETPALSPLVIGIVVDMLCVGMHIVSTL